jgi:phage tail-like protein
MPAASIIDPIIANRFYLDLGKEQVSTLSEVSGIEDETEVVETNQVSKSGKFIVRKIQGAQPLKSGKLTLKYAAFKEDPIKKWYDNIVNQKVKDARLNVSLMLYEIGKDAPTLTFSFKNAWPSKYSFSSFSAKGNEAVTITVTIEHSGMDVKGYNA